MEEPVCHFRAVIMGQNTGATDANGVGENGNWHGCGDENYCAPEGELSDKLWFVAFLRTALIGRRQTEVCRTLRSCEIGINDGECHQRHQRTNATARFDDSEAFWFFCAERHQLDHISLPQHR